MKRFSTKETGSKSQEKENNYVTCISTYLEIKKRKVGGGEKWIGTSKTKEKREIKVIEMDWKLK